MQVQISMGRLEIGSRLSTTPCELKVFVNLSGLIDEVLEENWERIFVPSNDLDEPWLNIKNSSGFGR